MLVEGTRAVAQGDFSQRAPGASRDELGMLTRSFNSMTLQLADARAEAQRKEPSSRTRRRTSKASSANLSAGVLAFDDDCGCARRTAAPTRSSARLRAAGQRRWALGALDPSLAP